MRSIRLGVMGWVALAAWAVNAHADGVRGGQWRITTQMTITGMPVVIPPVTVTQCVTPKDGVPRPSAQQGSCEVSDIKAEGNKFSWHVKCSGQRPGEGSGQVTYDGDKMNGQMTMQMQNPRSGQPMTVTQTITGQRVGDCPK